MNRVAILTCHEEERLVEKMDKKTLYLECYSGISGDMTVAALLDLGADQKVLMSGLDSLVVNGYHIVISRKTKSSIDACDFDVILEDSLTTAEHTHEHDSDHKHDYSDEHQREHSHDHQEEDLHHHQHGHSHDHQGENSQDHQHGHSHDHADLQKDASSHSHVLRVKVNSATTHMHLGHHEHRNLYDINLIIEQSSISANAKAIAKRIFQIVAVAEAKAHGKSIEEVHFHEVGAVDSIVDIVATAICLDNLNIKEVIVSELYEGTGQITCQHGLLPIPVPAVINIVAEHHLPLHITTVKGELVTPTGAAIVAAIRTKDSLPKEFNIQKIGLGAGKRVYENASGILRAMLIEDTTTTTLSDASSTTLTNTTADKVWVLEANIDDCSGEALAIAMELLFQNGAKDVYYTPIYMKKNRPAYLLGVICSEEKLDNLEEIIFTHTTTIGIRKHESLRTTLNREIKTVSTPFGDAKVKVCTYHDKTFYYPECESIKKLCAESGQDYLTLYHLVQTLAFNV